MIVQAISLLDDLDKELNNYSMRCREWYGWHFPELGKIVTDNLAYAKTVKAMGKLIRNLALLNKILCKVQICLNTLLFVFCIYHAQCLVEHSGSLSSVTSFSDCQGYCLFLL